MLNLQKTKKLTMNQLLLLTLAASAQVVSASPTPLSTTTIVDKRSLEARSFSYHDNQLSFHLDNIDATAGWVLAGGSFKINSHSVTDGQDPDGHLVDGSSQIMTTNDIDSDSSDVAVTFSVGRKGSETVGDWWNTNMPTIHTTFGHLADDLNFAIIGTMTIKVTNTALNLDNVEFTFLDVGLAQGHAFWDDNWWFACLTCTNIREDKVETFGVDKDGNKLYVHFKRGKGTDDDVIDIPNLSYNTPITAEDTDDQESAAAGYP